MHLKLMTLQLLHSSVGVSYYDSSIRQLHVLEVWEDGSTDFPLIDLGMILMSHCSQFPLPCWFSTGTSDSDDLMGFLLTQLLLVSDTFTFISVSV